LAKKVAGRFSAAVDMDDFMQILASLTRGFITLSQNHLALLESHFQLLLKWNRKINSHDDNRGWREGRPAFLGPNRYG
jgi:hypothetical protein